MQQNWYLQFYFILNKENSNLKLSKVFTSCYNIQWIHNFDPNSIRYFNMTQNLRTTTKIYPEIWTINTKYWTVICAEFPKTWLEFLDITKSRPLMMVAAKPSKAKWTLCEPDQKQTYPSFKFDKNLQEILERFK